MPIAPPVEDVAEAGTTGSGQETNNNDLNRREEKLQLLVQVLAEEVSERFVPAPTADKRTVDAINGIGDFKTRCRWAEFWRNDHKDRVETEQAVWASYYHNNPTLLSDAQWDRSLMDPEWQWPDPFSKKNYEEELEEEEKNLFTSGFMSGVKPEHKKKSAPIGSNELECFLKQVEEAIIAESLAVTILSES